MGSGKGTVRRTQSITKALPSAQAAMDWAKWEEFIKDSGLQNVNLYKYYANKQPEDCSDAEHERLLTDLFTDMVSVGAIILPSPYRAEDFRFKINTKNGQHFRQAKTVLKNHPKLGAHDNHFQYHYISNSKKMTSSNINFSIGRIIYGIDFLVAEAAMRTP